MQSREVRHEPDARRYTLWIDDKQVGLADYEVRGDAIAITHTEIDPSKQHGGLGSVLVQGVLDQIGEGTQRVIAACHFVETYIDNHDEYKPLLAR